MHDLEKALRMALVAHSGQTDKAGLPYIFHPIRVASAVTTVDEKVVALLHDSIEDSTLSIETIYTEFGSTVGNAVDALTKRDDTTYEDYIRGIKNDHIARAVKVADLKDNLDLSRLPTVTKDDLERVNKYTKALKVLS